MALFHSLDNWKNQSASVAICSNLEVYNDNSLLLTGDVHPNLGPTTKDLCPMCTRHIASCEVINIYIFVQSDSWVHLECFVQQRVVEYRRIRTGHAVLH